MKCPSCGYEDKKRKFDLIERVKIIRKFEGKVVRLFICPSKKCKKVFID